MGLANDLKDYLTSGGITATIVVGELPEGPDLCLSIAPYAGFGPTRTMSGTPGDAPLEHTRVQIFGRGGTYAAIDTLMASAYSKLSGLGERVINNRRYYFVTPVQTPSYLGLDPASRPMFSTNFDVLRAEST
jgi:hypothetical protein